MSLTDDWRAEKLKINKSYFISILGNEPIVAKLTDKNSFEHYDDFNTCCVYDEDDTDIEVLAPCDYDHFVELTEKVKKVEKLLEECRDYVVNTSVLEQGSKRKTRQIHDLLTKINEVMK